MLTASKIHVPSHGWTLHHESEDSIGWLIEEGLAARVMCIRNPSPTPANPAAAEPIYDRESKENGGALVELESVETSAGSVLRSVFKYPIPNQPLGTMIVGIALLSWPEIHARIHVEAVETGTTGMREAGVMLLDPTTTPVVAQEPTLVANAEELFEKMAQARQPLRRHPADDPKWDDRFPDHPLSRVRRHQRQILDTLTVEGMPRCG